MLAFKRIILIPEADEKTSLYALVQEYLNGRLKEPPHQRAFVWTESKVKGWVETIIKIATGERTSPPLGFFVTYQIRDTGEYFLNDGWQRLSATMLFMSNPKKYAPTGMKITEEVAEQMVQAYRIPVQHRHYDSPSEALYWFQVVNAGYALTAYDFSKGFLDYLDNNINWMPTLEGLHKFMMGLENSLTSRPSMTSLQQQHTIKRQNYALFYLWLSRRTRTSPDFARVTTKILNLNDAERGIMIEQKLGTELTKRNLSDVIQELKFFQVFIEEETKVISQIWLETKGALSVSARKPSSALYRWLLLGALWRRNNHMQNDDSWKDFLRLVFQHSDGSGVVQKVVEIIPSVETFKTIFLGIDSFSTAGRVTKLIGHEHYAKLLETKSKK